LGEPPIDKASRRNPLLEVSLLALRLGATAFGGPAAHIAMLRQEVVDRRKWISGSDFLDLIGITNLIPGPNSTEMVMHVGHLRAGRRGLVAAGTAFILPAATITLILAWFYVHYGTTPGGTWLLYGIKPVVIAIVVQAVWRLGRTSLTRVPAIVVAAAVVALYLVGANEIVLLFGGAAAYFAFHRLHSVAANRRTMLAIAAPAPLLRSLGEVVAGTVDYSAFRLFLTFLEIGSVLYGSGYVLVAFLRNELVVRLGWLTERQLLDAVAVGQVTPGPVFTTATFIGYVVGGFPGAVLATIGIFLPAFCFVGLIHPLITYFRQRPLLGELLDGVNAAAIGLMTGVLLTLTRAAIVDAPTAILAAVAGFLLIRFRINATWLIALGAAVGGVRWLLT
jgi:chromate transporter